MFTFRFKSNAIQLLEFDADHNLEFGCISVNTTRILPLSFRNGSDVSLFWTTQVFFYFGFVSFFFSFSFLSFRKHCFFPNFSMQNKKIYSAKGKKMYTDTQITLFWLLLSKNRFIKIAKKNHLIHEYCA